MRLAEMLATFERRAQEAERIGATAPVAAVLRDVAAELAPLVDGNGAAPAATPVAERWLTAAQVAELLHVSERWVYDHADQLGGKRLSPRCLRFPEAAVRRYIERRR